MIILAGDFNATITNDTTRVLSKHRHFTNWFRNTNITQISNNFPTRLDPRTQQQTAIDHIFLHPQAHQVDELYLLPFHHLSSDHRPLILSLLPNKKQTTIWRPKFNWEKYYNSILKDIKKQQAPTILSIQTVFLKYQRLQKRAQYHITIPHHWYKPSKTIKKLLKQAKAEKRANNPNYITTQKILRLAIRKDKKQQYRSFLHQTKTERNPKQFYTNIRKLKYPKTWNSDLAQGREEELLQTLNHDTPDTSVKLKELQERLNHYYSTTQNTFEPITINDLPTP
jgi:hypothetical protein